MEKCPVSVFRVKTRYTDASTITLSKNTDKNAFMCGSNFYETDVRCYKKNLSEST